MSSKRKKLRLSERRYNQGLAYYDYLKYRESQAEKIREFEEAGRLQESIDAELNKNELAFYERWGDYITGAARSFYESVSDPEKLFEDAKNSARMFSGRVIDMLVDGKIKDIDDITQQNEDLKKIKRFGEITEELNQKYRMLDNMRQQNQNVDNYQQFGSTGWNFDYERLIEDIQRLDNERQLLNGYFLGDGRNSEVVRKYMYNTDYLTPGQTAYMTGTYLQKDLTFPNPIDYVKRFNLGSGSIMGNLVKGEMDYAKDLTTSILSGASNVLDATLSGIKELFGGEKTTSRALPYLNTSDYDENKILQLAYVGNKYQNQINERLNPQVIQEDMDQYERELNEKSAQLSARIDFAKDGKISQLLRGFGAEDAANYAQKLDIDVYDPEDVPEQFKKEQEKYAKEPFAFLTHPIYTFPETGSTFGMLGYQIASMGWDGLMSYAAKKLPTWAIAPARVSALAGGIGAAVLSRKDETAVEKVEAMGERALEETIKNGGDYDKIFSAIRTQAAKLGIDTSGMDERRLFKLGIAYNMQTDDPAFEKAKITSRKGINKLVNANNALSFMDYVDMLPFLNYSGSALKRAADLEAAMVVSSKYAKQGLGTAEDLMLRGVLNKNSSTIRSVFDGAIDKAATKFIKKGIENKNALGRILYARDAAKFVGDVGGRFAFHNVLEGIEEGQQELLQSRYRRGVYDDYNIPESIMHMPEIFETLDLAQESIYDYFGLRPWDPDNGSEQLQAAMNIGLSAATMSSPIIGGFSHIVRRGQDSQFNQLIQKLKDDKQVVKFVGNDFANLQDYGRLLFFFDAFNKANATRSGMEESLRFLRDSVDESNTMVKKEDVDHDIDLMKAMWYMYHENEAFNNKLKEENIYHGGAYHREAAIAGAKHIVDYNNTHKNVTETLEELDKDYQRLVNFVEDIFNEDLSAEYKEQLRQQDAELANAVEKILGEVQEDSIGRKTRKNYNEYASAKRRIAENERQAYIKNFSREQFETDETIQAFLRDNGFDVNQAWMNESIRERAITKLYKKLQKQDWKDKYILSDNSRKAVDKWIKSISGNKYIMQAFRELRPDGVTLRDFIQKAQASEDLLDEVLNRAYEIRNGGIYSEKDYVIDRLTGLRNYRMLQATEAALSTVQNRVEFLKWLRSEFGYDIDPSRLEGIGIEMQQYRDNLVELEKNTLNPEKSDKKGERLLKYSDIFDRDMWKDVHIGNEENVMRLQTLLAINTAIMKTQAKLKDAYQYLSVDPNTAKKAIFGNTESSTYLDDTVKEFGEKTLEIQTKDQLSRRPGEDELNRRDLQKIKEKAAWQIIKAEMKDREERKWIARRHLEEDGTITPAMSENIQQQELNEAENKEGSKEKESTATSKRKIDSRTKQEKELAAKYAGERIDRQKLVDRAKKRAEKKNKKKTSATNVTTLDYIDRIEDGSYGSNMPVVEEGDTNTWGDLNWVDTVLNSKDGLIIAYVENKDDEPHYVRVTRKSEQDAEGNTVHTVRVEEIKENDESILVISRKLSFPDPDPSYNESGSTENKDSQEAKIITDEKGKPIHIEANGIVYEATPEPEIIPTPLISPDPNEEEAGPSSLELVDENKTVELVEPEGETNNEQAELNVDNEPEELNVDTEPEELDVDDSIVELDIDEVPIDHLEDIEINSVGKMVYNGEVLSEQQQKEVEEELELLAMADSENFDQQMLPRNQEFIRPKDAENNATYDSVGRLYSRTFFYDPWADETINLTVGKEHVKLPKPLAPGRQLAQKLVQKGWFEKTKKYYIVTQPEANKKIVEGSDIRDSMTVTLIIEDDKNCYACTLRSLGTVESDIEGDKNQEKYTVDAEAKRRNALQLRGANWAQIEADTNQSKPVRQSDQAALYRKAVNDYAMMLAEKWWQSEHGGSSEGFKNWWNSPILKKNYRKTETEAYNRDVELRKAKRRQYLEVARKHYSLPKANIISYEEIDKEIERLREVRNKIIDAYLKKDKDNNYIFPKEIRTDVEPLTTNQSNGKIDNTGEYRNITPEDQSIEDIQKALEVGNIVLGFGRGKYGRNQNYIDALLSNEDITLSEYGGLSGKIYMFVESLSKGASVPIMLLEEKFNTLVKETASGKKTNYINSADDVYECLHYNNSTKTIEIVNNKGYKPSAAEVLFYMLSGKYDFGTYDYEQQDEIIEFFLHHGEKTLLKNQPTASSDPRTFLASKQLSVEVGENGKRIINIAVLNRENGLYEIKLYTEEDLFTGEETICSQNRREVIAAIAKQMHWNTDRDHMKSMINADDISGNAMSRFLANLFSTVNVDEDAFLDQEVSILGCPQLSFKASDFYKKDGRDIVAKKVSVTAWMIKNGKLKTDVSKQVFKDPFVFASGVKNKLTRAEKNFDETAKNAGVPEANVVNVTGPQQQEKKTLKEGKKEPAKVNSGFNILDNERREGFLQDTNKRIVERLTRGGFKIALTEDEQKEIRLVINQTEGAKQHGGIRDRFIIRLPKEKLSKQDAIKYVKDRIAELLSKYDKSLNVESVQMKLAEFEISNVCTKKDGILVFDVYNDGQMKVFVDKFATVQNHGSKYTAVYSKIKGRGKLDVASAKAWLAEKLGLGDNRVVIKAVMRSTDGEPIYGLTRVAFDKIYNELVGFIELSESDGEGMQYHEAWHYVNLLMHTPEEREALWDEYYKTHKRKYKKGKPEYREIEEDMAEDFRKYMEGVMDKSWTGKIKRFFSNVFRLILASRRKAQYRMVYEKIHAGGYNTGDHIDQSAAREFENRYRKGVPAMDYVSGVKRKYLKKMPNINSYHEFFDALEAVINRIYVELDLSTVDKIAEYSNNKKSFNDILYIVQKMIDEQSNPTIVTVLKDIQNNPAVLRYALLESFTDLGLNVKIKKNKNGKTDPQEVSNLAGQREEKNDFSWDIFELTVSKKDNAGFRTKLFLKLIPVYVRDPETGEAVPAGVDEYGTERMYGFDEAWNKIIELWQISSMEDLDDSGNYAASSLMGTLQRNAKSDPFYQAVLDKLQDLENVGEAGDIQLRSLIYSTICSHKQPIAYIQIQDPIQSAYSIDDDYLLGLDDIDVDFDTNVIADRLRDFILLDDSNLMAARAIPRRWSKKLAQNGLIEFDRKTGQTVVSSIFAKKVKSAFSDLLSKSEKYNLSTQKKNNVKYSSTELSQVKEDLYTDLINLFNTMGMPIDTPTMNLFVVAYAQSKKLDLNTDQDIINILYKILSSNAVGSIQAFVQQIVNSGGRAEIVNQTNTKYARDLDQVYDNYFEVNGAYTQITRLALAYNAVHPSPADYKVKGPNGEMYYPISENNTLSSNVRALNDKQSGKSAELRQCAYCDHSAILNAADKIDENDADTKLKLMTFVGFKDANKQKGADYFEITPMEDFIMKMFITERDMIIFPTMADKKTWYALRSKNIKLVHDTMLLSPNSKTIMDLVYEEYEKISPFDSESEKRYNWENAARNWYALLDQDDPIKVTILKRATDAMFEKADSSVGFSRDDNGVLIPRYSDNTINIFCGYFMDELNSLIDYYDRKHIEALVKDPTIRKKNFHGKVSNGRMDFSGNGGKFRYFYDVFTFDNGTKKKNEDDVSKYNLNQKLEALYKLLLKIESGEAVVSPTEFEKYAQKSKLREGNEKLDGFELIRMYLKDLKKQVKQGNTKNAFSKTLKDAINNKLISQAFKELNRVSQENSPIQIAEFKDGVYNPTAIPKQLLKRYTDHLLKAKLGNGRYGSPYDGSIEEVTRSALFSLVANYVANSAISIIEVEKVFTGDPAYYKYNENEFEGLEKQKITASFKFDDGKQVKEEVEVTNYNDIFSDKIKRLGGFLSPGLEIRLSYNKAELDYDREMIENAEDPSIYMPLSGSKYSNLNVEDIEIPSLYLHEQNRMFKTQLVVNYIMSNLVKEFDKIRSEINKEREKNNKSELSIEKVIGILYSKFDLVERIYKTLPEKAKAELDHSLKLQKAPYQNITVTDAQVFIRPALYRKIRIGLGEWSYEEDENGYSDEKAYKILETDASWMTDAEKSKIVLKFQAYVLKMSYSNNEISKIAGKQFNFPLYNKMAIFPLFKFHASTNVGNMLYKRMNQKGEELDMISFKSAVKVGAVQKGIQLTKLDRKETIKKLMDAHKDDKNYKPTEDEIFDAMNIKGALSELNEKLLLPNSVHIEYGTDKITPNTGTGEKLAVTIQDLHNLRMQLNTKAHEAEVRAIGTQMFKIAFSNIIDNFEYGSKKEGRGTRFGWLIKQDIMNCINKLTEMGELDLRKKFYKDFVSTDKDGKPVTTNALDPDKVRSFIKQVIDGNNLGTAAEDIIAAGGVAACLMSRGVFELAVSATVNRNIVDINTKGGTAIQQSVYGFVGYGNQNVGTQSESNYFAYNDGEELKWSAKEGSMEVLLSMNFFKQVLPAKLKSATYSEQRQWLIDNDIIKGTKSDKTKSNPKPFGVGYRIPTQGMSSMFSFIVADVLPQECGDLIVVPREFTAQTGSDFDIDKLFLATMSYKDGEIEDGNTQGGFGNRLLLNYIDIISDPKNYADARGSIDVLTKKLKNELINPYLKLKQIGYIDGMDPLLPSFQALRKMEFSTGKSGIGPYALNITNLALTQAMHLDLDLGNLRKQYGFGHLDDISGRDGILISSWLSAMVNAHVDVAKDPYIFDLNINKSTYNHSALLLRLGMGMSTFTFLAQPILKLYAQQMNNAGGVYGGNIDGSNPDSKRFLNKLKQLYIKNTKYYIDKLKAILNEYGSKMENKEKEFIDNAIAYFENVIAPKDKKSKEPIRRPYGYGSMFDEEVAKTALRYHDDSDYIKRMRSFVYQLCVLETFNELEPNARLLSELVQCSRIDTKKFGNNCASQINFLNKYNSFRYSSENWTINKEGFDEKFTTIGANDKPSIDKKARSKEALRIYFEDSYLHKKLIKATAYTATIMRELLFTANRPFQDVFRKVAAILYGEHIYTDVNGKKVYTYDPIYKDEVVQSISSAIDNTMRFNSLMTHGYSIYKKEKDKRSDTKMIDFTMQGNKDAVIENMKRLLFGNDKEQSIFNRLSTLMDNIRKSPFDEKYDGLTNFDGDIVNDLLLYLDPQSPNSKYPIGRMLLSTSQMDINKNTKRRLITAFYELLNSEDKEIRRLARDLAFYAYYSTYDLNTTNSFFDLVPPEYRHQYDLALASTLRGLSSNHEDVKINALASALGMKQASETYEETINDGVINMMDTISRNFWYDVNIVPSVYLYTYSNERFQNDSCNTVTGQNLYDNTVAQSYPQWIASKSIKNSPLYITINKRGYSMLYKKIGKVDRYVLGEDDLKKNLSTFDVYMAVLKAGLHKGKINQYELYAGEGVVSIFDDNKLPSSEFSENLVREDVEKRVKKDTGDYILEVLWYHPEVPEMYSETSSIYAKPAFNSGNIGRTSVYMKENSEYNAQKQSDVIIDIVDDETESMTHNISSKYKEKVVTININGDLSEAISKIKELIGEKEADFHFTSPIFDRNFPISEDVLQTFIQQLIDEYRAHINNEDPEAVEAAVKEYKELLEKPYMAENSVKQYMFNERMLEIVTAFNINGIHTRKITAAVTNDHSRCAKAVGYLNRNHGELFDTEGSVFVEKNIVATKKKFKALLKNLSEDIDFMNDNEDIEEEVKNTESSAELEALTIVENNIDMSNKQRVNQPVTSSNAVINIYAGTGENVDLSNFAERPVDVSKGEVSDILNRYVGKAFKAKFRTVEGAFQAMKIFFSSEGYTELYIPQGGLPTIGITKKGDQMLTKFENASGSQARSLGRQINGLDKDKWDKVSSVIMKALIKASFEQNPQALQRLLDTGNATLTHTQDRGKWGTEFPRLLMEVRDELRSSLNSLQNELSLNVVTNKALEESEKTKDHEQCSGGSKLVKNTESSAESDRLGSAASDYLETDFDEE